MTTLEHVTIEQKGLKLNVNPDLTPPGSLKDCDNIVIRKAATFASRRGFKLAGSAINILPASTTPTSTADPGSEVTDSTDSIDATESPSTGSSVAPPSLHESERRYVQETIVDLGAFNNDFILTTTTGTYHLPARLLVRSEKRFSLAELTYIDSATSLTGSFYTEDSFYYYQEGLLKRYTPLEDLEADGTEANEVQNPLEETLTLPAPFGTASSVAVSRAAVFYRPPAPYCKHLVTEHSTDLIAEVLAVTGEREAITPWLETGHAVAYRLAWTRRHGNGTLLRSQPSPRTIVTNTENQAVAPVFEIVPPFNAQVGDTIELYASAPAETGVPDDAMRLVRSEVMRSIAPPASETPDPTPSDSESPAPSTPVPSTLNARNLVTLVDTTGRRLYYNLYTNATESGIHNENTPPPYASVAAVYKNFVVYGNGLHRSALTIELKEGSTFKHSDRLAVTSTRGDRFSVVALGEENVGDKFVIASSIRETCYNLAQAINRHSLNTFVRAFIYEDDGYFTLYLESREVDHAFRVHLTNILALARGNAFYPDITTVTEAAPYHSPNSLYISKAFIPEAVPHYRTLSVGHTNDPILALVTNKEYLYIFKTSGLYKLSGADYESFTIKKVEDSLRLIAPRAVTTLGDTLYYLSGRGVVAVRYDQSEVISDDIKPLLVPHLTRVDVKAARLCAYPHTQQILLAVPQRPYDETLEQIFVYHGASKEWTKWTLRNITTLTWWAKANTLVTTSRHHVFVEKKEFADNDYSDLDVGLVWSDLGKLWRCEDVFRLSTQNPVLSLEPLAENASRYTLKVGITVTTLHSNVRADEKLLHVKLGQEVPLSIPALEVDGEARTLPSDYTVPVAVHYTGHLDEPIYRVVAPTELSVSREGTAIRTTLDFSAEIVDIPNGVPKNFLPQHRLNYHTLTLTGHIAYKSFHTHQAVGIEVTNALQYGNALVLALAFRTTAFSQLMSGAVGGYLALDVDMGTTLRRLTLPLTQVTGGTEPFIRVGELALSGVSYTLHLRRDFTAEGSSELGAENRTLHIHITRTGEDPTGPVTALSPEWAERHLVSLQGYLYESYTTRVTIMRQYANIGLLTDFEDGGDSRFLLDLIALTEAPLLEYDPVFISLLDPTAPPVLTRRLLQEIISQLTLTVTLRDANDEIMGAAMNLTHVNRPLLRSISLINPTTGQSPFSLNFIVIVTEQNNTQLVCYVTAEITRGLNPQILTQLTATIEDSSDIPLVLYKKSPQGIEAALEAGSALSESGSEASASIEPQAAWHNLSPGPSSALHHYFLIPAAYTVIPLGANDGSRGTIIEATAEAYEEGPFIAIALIGDLSASTTLSGFLGGTAYPLATNPQTGATIQGLRLGDEWINGVMTLYFLAKPLTGATFRDMLLSLEPLVSYSGSSGSSGSPAPSVQAGVIEGDGTHFLPIRYDNILLRLYEPIRRAAFYNAKSLGAPALLKELRTLHLDFTTTNSYLFELAIETDRTTEREWLPIRVEQHSNGYGTERFGVKPWGGSLTGRSTSRISAPRNARRHHHLSLAWRDSSLNKSLELSSLTAFYTIPPQDVR